MNANELADWLDKFYANTENNMVNRAATMLRQQQAEIEALKTELEDCVCQAGHSEAYLKAKGRLK